jgi:hypothetical protein
MEICFNFFLIGILGGGGQLGPLGTAAVLGSIQLKFITALILNFKFWNILLYLICTTKYDVETRRYFTNP